MSDSYSAPSTTGTQAGSGASPNPISSADTPNGGIDSRNTGAYGSGQASESAPTGLPEGFDISKLDLNLHPGFKEHKSKMDKQIDMMSKQYQYTQNVLQQQQQRAAYLEQQLEQQMLAGKDDYQVLEHNFKKAQAELQRVKAEQQQYQNYMQHQRFLQTVREEYEVDLPEDIQDPQQAVLHLTKTQRDTIQSLKAQIAQLERKAGAISAADSEQMDLGGGAPVGLSAIQSQYNQAMLKLDGQTADRLSRRAAEEGLELDRYAWLKERK
jgi:DNA repair exonuclease SbcCD ATPase subunit